MMRREDYSAKKSLETSNGKLLAWMNYLMIARHLGVL